MSKNIKKVSFIFLLLITMMLFTNTIYAQQNYDVVNLDATTYNYKPSPINPGDHFEIWIQLTNNSNVEAKDIEYILETEYPFSLVEEGKKIGTINTIAPFQTKILKFDLKTEYNAPAGSYEINLKFKRSGLEIYNIQKYNIDISSQKAIIDIIDTFVEPVKIGSSSNISFTIKNLSGRDARDIFITLSDSENEDIKILNVKTKYLESLKANELTNVEFSIIVDKYATNKTYTLPINISYKDYEGEYAIQRHVGFEVIDNPELLLTIQRLGTNFTLNSKTKESIDLEIYNVGNVDAEAVYVEITSDAIEREVRYFLGTIEKDNYDNIELRFDTKDVYGKHTFNIKIIYKNSNLDEQTITETIEANIVKPNAPVGGVMMIISTIFSIIGLIIGIGILIIILKWIYKVVVKPAYKDLFKIFRK
jgi:hypothetical protein